MSRVRYGVNVLLGMSYTDSNNGYFESKPVTFASSPTQTTPKKLPLLKVHVLTGNKVGWQELSTSFTLLQELFREYIWQYSVWMWSLTRNNVFSSSIYKVLKSLAYLAWYIIYIWYIQIVTHIKIMNCTCHRFTVNFC